MFTEALRLKRESQQLELTYRNLQHNATTLTSKHTGVANAYEVILRKVFSMDDEEIALLSASESAIGGCGYGLDHNRDTIDIIVENNQVIDAPPGIRVHVKPSGISHEEYMKRLYFAVGLILSMPQHEQPNHEAGGFAALVEHTAHIAAKVAAFMASPAANGIDDYLTWDEFANDMLAQAKATGEYALTRPVEEYAVLQ